MTLHDQFINWLFKNYVVWNGDRLTELEEDGDIQLKFLSDMGLPPETEII